MTRILLLLLFFVMLTADMLGLNLSLAPGLSIKNAFLYLIFTGIAIETALKRNRRFELMPVIVPYTLYFFYAASTIVVVMLIMNYPGYRLLRSIINLKVGAADNLLVFLVFFYGILTAKDALSVMKMMVWIVVAANIVTVADAFNLPDLGLIDERFDGRIGGPIGESNQYAAFLALFMPASIALVFIERGVLRVLAILGVAASFLALLMTASRGGFAGVLVGAAIGAIFLRKFISGRSIVSAIGAMTVVAFFLVGILVMAGYGDLLHERVIGASTDGNVTNISSGRIFIWTKALNKMIDEPASLITGFGWDTYRQFRVFRYAPHNSYLKIFFELGAIGLVLVLLTFANILRAARQGIREADSETLILLFSFVFGLISILIAIFFVDIYSPWLFVWAFVGTAMRLAIVNQNSAISRARHNPNSGNARYSASVHTGKA